MKLKTKKTLIKRLRISSNGKLLKQRISGSHLRIKLRSGRKHRNARDNQINIAYSKIFKKALPGI